MEVGKLVGRGRTANVYEWGEAEVIKLFEPFTPNPVIESEYRKSTIVNQLGVPIPFVKQLLEINGQEGIVYEKLTGNTLLEIMKSNPFRIKNSIEKVAELHTKLSNCYTKDLPDIKTIIKDSMKNINTNILDSDKKRLINDYIDKLPNKNALCHLDFHPDNIIITKFGPKIIDWCNAAAGDPCADAAITVLIFTLCNNPPGTSKLVNIVSKIIAKYIKNVYLEKYLMLSHKTPEEIDKWLLPAAVLRLSYNLPEEERTLKSIIDSKLLNI